MNQEQLKTGQSLTDQIENLKSYLELWRAANNFEENKLHRVYCINGPNVSGGHYPLANRFPFDVIKLYNIAAIEKEIAENQAQFDKL